MKNKKYLAVFFSYLLTIFIHTPVYGDTSTRLTLLTENYGKFNFSLSGSSFEHDGKYIGGSSTHFVKQLLQRADIPYKMKLRSWPVAYGRALERANYGVFSTGRTELREDLFDWVGPIARYNWVVIVPKGSNLKIRNINDLKGLHVGGYKNDAMTQFIEEQGISVSKPTSDSVNPKKLHEGLIDVWISSDAIAWDLAKASGYDKIEVAYVVKTVDMYLAMNKDTDPQWLATLHQTYDELVSEGALTLPSY